MTSIHLYPLGMNLVMLKRNNSTSTIRKPKLFTGVRHVFKTKRALSNTIQNLQYSHIRNIAMHLIYYLFNNFPGDALNSYITPWYNHLQSWNIPPNTYYCQFISNDYLKYFSITLSQLSFETWSCTSKYFSNKTSFCKPFTHFDTKNRGKI